MPFLSNDDAVPEGCVPIPTAQGPVPFLGTLSAIDPEVPMQSVVQLAEQYGEIFRMRIPGVEDKHVVSTHALVNECCDEKRFRKMVAGVIKQFRECVHDGLFTAESKEPNWGIAHRILVPAFGPMAIRGMFDEMHDIATQLALKWARHGSTAPIMVTDDFTRLTLDTISLCSMGYRFNSFYHDGTHEFIDAMNTWLVECGNKERRILPSVFHRAADFKFNQDMEVLRKTAGDVLAARKADPDTKRKDLLTAMLEGVDPKTGQKMSDTSIIDNLITFLIAGHETTSGMLSFAFFHMLKNPATYRRAQEEVDQVCGRGPIRVEHMSKLPYINAVLRETLRLQSTIPMFGVQANNDEIIGGKYHIRKDEPVFLAIIKSHLDPKVYGDNAKEFVPERMLDENFERTNREFPNSWKPFGNGMRACIGRAFAWQEALLITAMLLQNFNFVMHDPAYQLTVKETLTLKPDGFYMRAVLRHDMSPTQLEHRLAGRLASESAVTSNTGTRVSSPAPDSGTPISIFYGSNSGTCEALAHRLAADASAQGFRAVTVDALDAANQKLPKDPEHPVVIITASYEGLPPDNAGHFVEWLENLKGEGELGDVKYAVFGCGHHDWTRTFHRIPKLVDDKLAEHGGQRLAPLGLADAADGDIFVDFETWEFEQLWPALSAKFKAESDQKDATATDLTAALSHLTVEVSHPRPNDLRQDVGEAVVVAAHTLTAPGAPPKRHMEIKLPRTGGRVQYTTGDYLAVLPLNPKASVDRAMRRFGLARDAHVTIRAGGRTTLPTNTPVSAQEILSAYVELAIPATKRGIAVLAEAAEDEETKVELGRLAGDAYAVEISAKRAGILDILERFPQLQLPFGTFLALLPPMRVRQYSISSTPMWKADHATLTYSVLAAPSLARPGEEHLGVASNYLAGLGEGDRLHVALRPSHAAFHPPAGDDAAKTPIVCVAAGSGLAPFRGFVQERAALAAAGRKLAPMLLFLGCREPGVDDLYREELDAWEKAGAVSVRRAFSRKAEESEGCKYVQDRLVKDRAEVEGLWKDGAKVFVCGSREMGEGVKEALHGMLGEGDVQAWYEGVRNTRYASDVFD